jgi:hypothetical protein
VAVEVDVAVGLAVGVLVDGGMTVGVLVPQHSPQPHSQPHASGLAVWPGGPASADEASSPRQVASTARATGKLIEAEFILCSPF